MAITKPELTEFLSQQGANVEALQDDSPLFSSMLLDSMKMVDLVMFVEKACGFRVGAGDLTLENFDTIERVLRFCECKCASS